MLPLVITLSCVQVAFLGVFLFWARKIQDEIGKKERYFAGLQELDLRMEVLETRWKRLLEEMEERIERGNDAWRRWRSREAGRERRAQRQEELEGESEDDTQEVLPLDVSGSDPRGLSYMPRDLADTSEPAWRSVARQMAEAIARGEGH